MKYLAQPYWSESVVRIYALPAKTLVTTVTLAHTGPNDVLIFRDPPANKAYMMVSYDLGAGGAIDIYNLADINLALPANTPPATTLAMPNAVVGMAVQPGTGDLYVATFSTGTPGGVYSFTHASGYAAASRQQFASYADAWNDVAQYCANLAFDPHGHLWMTTFQDGAAGNQFLICFAQVDRAAGSAAKFFKIGNPAAKNLSAVTLPGSATAAAGLFNPLSQPEGLAFDPRGNLWLANNSDDFNTNGFAGNGEVNGTLLRLDRSWIDQHLLTNAGILGTLTADGYGGTQHIGAADPGVTLYYYNGGRFGGLLFDGFTLYVNDQSPNDADPGHTVVWQLQTDDQPLKPTSFATSGIATTYPGNGQMAVFNSTPPSLLIRDAATDTGLQPSGVALMWESPDIAVTNTSILGTFPGPNAPRASDAVDLASDGTISGPNAFAYVRVTNVGAVATTGTEVLKLYWAKASAGLDWPAPWDGLRFDSSAAKPPLGGLIGARAIGPIDPGHETVFELPWANVPDPGQYSLNDTHFCLVARIEEGGLYPFGMSYPEQVNGVAEAAIAYNTVSNSRIGWRNIAILPPVAMMHRGPIRLGVLGANHAPHAKVMRFAVETLNRHGVPTRVPGTVMLHAAGAARERLLQANAEGHAAQHAGHGRFPLHDLAIRLAPHEVLPFHVEFEPAEGVTDFAVRVVQYVETRHGPRLLGGQTFVVGRVRGFAVREPPSRR
ncbi:MAG: hypothetical protein U1E23_16690 [Reyranellaceae bacterium]